MTKRHKHASLAHAGPGASTTAAVAFIDNDHSGTFVSDQDIRLCAYRKWEAAGATIGDGVQFWLEAEQELESKNEKLVQRSGWHGDREAERLDAEKAIKDRTVSQDTHYRDNNRMFQSHGDRGHRGGGSS